MDVTWIERTDVLDDWVRAAGAGAVAVDTEADSFHHYREKVCLIQLTSGGRHALIDPLAEVDVAPLTAPFEDAGRRKYFHGADYDVRLLQRDFGLIVRNLFDTSIAARLTGEPAVGLAALLEKHVGVVLDKSHQRADWSKRPLTSTMREYAVADTMHLEALAAILERNASELGRDAWVREECERLEAVRWRDRREEDPEPFRRVKGSAALDRAALAVLREIWTWRDSIASRRDRPAFRVLRDESLLAIAKSPPASVGDLSRIAGFPDYLLRSPSALALLDAVRRGAACPEEQWPAPPAARRPRTDPEVEVLVDAIKGKRDALAAELALDPSLIASRAVMEEMAKRQIAAGDPWSVPDLRAWQVGLLRPRLG
jgi:ribonuclease D